MPLEAFKVLTYRQLMWRRFKRHKLAMAGAVMLVVLYGLALLADFAAPYAPTQRVPGYISAPPQRLHVWGPDGFHVRPFVYGLDLKVDAAGFQRIYSSNTSRMIPVRWFVRGERYSVLGLFKTDMHLFGVEPSAAGEPPATIFLFGSDRLGRDMLSRILHGARVTLSIGLVGMSLSFVLGCVLGSISGYYGGVIDTIIQRVIEFIVSIPTLPLWMALSAALPAGWPMYQRYFGITLILSLVGWCGLARVVRGQILQLRDQDFVTAARCASASDGWIIFRHLLPSTMSYLIVSITLAIPGMILGETALSFLGLGIQAPAVSWGTLLQDAQNIRTLANQPWVLIPGAFVVLTVISFNFVGDGLRDAVDPHGK
ncbi:MAG: ABC transporter permease [Planctomycetaceae bacterium]|nr:ABC transporter permease [Planctomycetaceae bacterium]